MTVGDLVLLVFIFVPMLTFLIMAMRNVIEDLFAPTDYDAQEKAERLWHLRHDYPAPHYIDGIPVYGYQPSEPLHKEIEDCATLSPFNEEWVKALHKQLKKMPFESYKQLYKLMRKEFKGE